MHQRKAEKLVLRNPDMLMWTSGFPNPLVYTDFNMFGGHFDNPTAASLAHKGFKVHLPRFWISRSLWKMRNITIVNYFK